MNPWKAKLMFPLLLLPFACDVVLTQTQLEMNEEACKEYKRSDVELNKVYQQILSEYKADAIFVQKMTSAQRAWIRYRKANLESLYPAVIPQRAYGSVYLMCRCMTLAEFTKRRTEELRRWVTGVEEGDVCSGSLKIRGYTGALRRTRKPHRPEPTADSMVPHPRPCKKGL